MKDDALSRLAARVGVELRHAGLRVVTAESCTAGWIAKALTDVAGSSEWVDGGYVTYSNEAKVRALGVSPRTLDRFGAVSRETVLEMALGALRASGVEVAVAVTGIAGPDGGSPGKPVGTVWLCAVRRRGARTARVTLREHFRGDREAVRRKSVERALRLIVAVIAPPSRRGSRVAPRARQGGTLARR